MASFSSILKGISCFSREHGHHLINETFQDMIIQVFFADSESEEEFLGFNDAAIEAAHARGTKRIANLMMMKMAK